MTKNKSFTSDFRRAGIAAIVLMLALTSATVPAQVTQTAAFTVKNFGKVNDNYYRGEQPTRDEFAQLKKFGIKTVIDLRQDKLAKAEEEARGAGLQYFNIPLKASRMATEEQTNYFLGLVNNPANWPVYVHCKGGRHRTGGMTAVYRITHDGWTADQAYAEMEQYDFNNGIFGGPGAQKKYVYTFYDRYKAAHGQGTTR
ncbi:MAG: dual specificity protein phosphatase family protein [Pyrinomonadaceae bacterium]